MAQSLSGDEQDEQDDILGCVGVGLKTMDDDEIGALRDQLDADHESQVDDGFREFDDNAIGDEHWDADREHPRCATPPSLTAPLVTELPTTTRPPSARERQDVERGE